MEKWLERSERDPVVSEGTNSSPSEALFIYSDMMNDWLEPAIRRFSVARIAVHETDELFVHERALVPVLRSEVMARVGDDGTELQTTDITSLL